MNWRAVVLSGVLAAGLSVSAVPQAAAKHWDRDFDESRYDRCSQITDRIDLDHSKIDEIGPTGRHRKALQWYEDDLRNAERDLDRCRYGDETASYDPDPYYPNGRSSDPDYDSGRDDPSYDDSNADQGFDIKRDWPMLLGLFLPNQQ